ncbi:MAG: ABC transporter substrate-binding protein [Lachnospiraceae bacterium]
MSKNKFVALGLATIMVVTSLLGCGKSTGGSKENVTLKVALWDYSNTQYYKTMFDAFTEAYPNIKIEPIEFTADEYDNVIVTQLGGKQDFDVVFTKGTPALSALIAQGHILALDDYMKEDKNFDSANYSGLVEQLSIDGKTYGIPYRKDNNLLFYNKDLFDKAKVDYPTDGMTMDEYYELAKKMTSGEGNDKVFGAHVHTWPGNIYIYSRRLNEFNVIKNNGEVLKPYYESILKMQEEGIIQDYGALKSSNIHYSGVFYNQQAAMMQMGTWFINMLVENVQDFNWGVCTLPNLEGTGNDTAVGGITPVSIGAYAKHPQEAWQFINYICGEEGAKVLAQTGIVPGYTSDEINKIFDEIHTNYPNAPENLSKYIDIPTYYAEQDLDKDGKEIDTILQEVHSAIMTKSVSVDDGLADLKKRIDEVKAK